MPGYQKFRETNHQFVSKYRENRVKVADETLEKVEVTNEFTKTLVSHEKIGWFSLKGLRKFVKLKLKGFMEKFGFQKPRNWFTKNSEFWAQDENVSSRKDLNF